MAALMHLLLLLFLPLSSSADSIGQFCDKSFKTREIQTSINKVLSDLVSEATISGFSTSSFGQGSNLVYGLAQCRGDVSSDDCATCIADAAKKLQAVCPMKADARVWYDYCFMRYDTSDFIGKADTGYAIIYFNVENATNPEKFDKEVGSLMSKVREQAVQQGSGGLGRGKSLFTPFITIYGLAQCTRDLEPLPCAQCLSSAVEKFPDYCQYRKGCQAMASTILHHLLLLLSLLIPLASSSNSSHSFGPLGHYCGKPTHSKKQITQVSDVLNDTITKALVSGFAVYLGGPYILAQCRGDVSPCDCQKCLLDAEQQIQSQCTNQPAEATIWYDYCLLRYSLTNFIGKVDTDYYLIFPNDDNATNPDDFDDVTSRLMDVVSSEASLAGSAGLGRGKIEFQPHIFIYGLGQCTEDLDIMPCHQCLSAAGQKFLEYCRFRKGCQVLFNSCMARYELYPFFFPLDPIDHDDNDIKVPMP
ncbi:hypothetical protein J5N97_030184 [Dioscorea zingiberensis]|uniref:Gnk2-homologous domain-containing protein n=1 Tax=Dioscorea zingiberensis TaxID=325984 RepID=A0A9D5H411_9LILI|nr:hypothetical protein J5N97_030184 [Dioscorea zingiberensis]